MEKIWDTVVIGGGPAGMMAAGTAAERGNSVLLLEKNNKLGKKLLITGGGRCNVTNNKKDISKLINSYREKPKPLYSLFSRFSVEDTLNFFNSRGLETKVEAEDRVFPITDKAESVWQILVDYINMQKVAVKYKSEVKDILDKADYKKVITKNNSYKAKSVVIAAGGNSYPETGSTGDGFKWLKKLGHSIIPNSFALVPISVKEEWISEFAGLTLRDINISIWQDNKKVESKQGKVLFTHLGLTGPTILNLSSLIGTHLQYGNLFIGIDLVPALSIPELDGKLIKLCSDNATKKLKNILSEIIPSKLVKQVLGNSNIDLDKFNHSISKAERKELVKSLKDFRLEAKSLLGKDKAIVSAGGVDIAEVNFQTMESRITPGIFIIGDVLNIDRPSGGYSLQICWASGFVAGRNC